MDKSLRERIFRDPRRPIYLDYQATTPMDPRVLDAMMPYLTERFGNPHSVNHAYGWEAGEAVELAREQVAGLLGAEAREIVFTSGATESNNLAIKGVAHFHGTRKRHLITCVTEHKCVLEACRRLEREGFRVTWLPVDGNGLIDLDALDRAFTEDTVLVSIMMVNNEIGVIQPLAEIGAICRERKVFFHTDAAQAVGKMPIDVNAMNLDLLSISGHKIYAPKGIGALYVRRRPRVRLEPLFDGGGQERGMRAGTLPAALCVGLGEACRIAGLEMAEEERRIRGLRDRLHHTLCERLSGVQVNGDLDLRIHGNLNLSFAGVRADALLAGLARLAISSGSACSTVEVGPSHVLQGLGIEEDLALGSLRFGIGRYTTEDEIDEACALVVEQVERLRRANRARDMGEGIAGGTSGFEPVDGVDR
jgi:cysteine desulfurase